MYLRAGIISLGLLLLSRVLGLARESVQASTFGTTAVADLVVVMLTLPDLAGAILAGGALSYALLPWWARQSPAALAASQRRVALFFLAAGLAVAGWIMLWPQVMGGWLAPGLSGAMQPLVENGMRWAALAVPASMLTLVWYTRLQHERDVIGMYGMNVVHTGVVIGAMLAVAPLAGAPAIVAWLGAGLLLAFGMRLVFLFWRLKRLRAAQEGVANPEAADASPQGLPHARIWLWALLATGAPVALPLLARSLVSSSGEGALATFNYAWKLVELPSQLAIQVVATLAFPAFTRAHAEGRDYSVQLRAAFMLAWTLACAAALSLWLGAAPLAQLLFGWGRMGPQHVAEVAQWSALGAWTLLPQALITVLLLVLATQQRLRAGALAYLAALAVLLLAGARQGPEMMLSMLLSLAVVLVCLLWAAREQALPALAWRDMAIPAAVCAVLAAAKPWLPTGSPVAVLLLAGAGGALVLAAGYLGSPALKAALKR